MTQIDTQVTEAISKLRQTLLNDRDDDGHWRGRLSSSALATAIAIRAFLSHDAEAFADHIDKARTWLARTQNKDGGWGDSIRSQSNLTTTLLTWCVMDGEDGEAGEAAKKAEKWIADKIGGTDAQTIIEAIFACYGKDRTFAAPILMMCAISGKLGDCGWRIVPQLPFEMAVLPRSLFNILKLTVVSYAIPALIAVGLAKHRNAPGFLLMRVFRNWATAKVLAILEQMQPDSGGFLEAMPLTGFVCMALSAAGLADNPVKTRGIAFLDQTQRPDGSWPIDTDLATWVSTLSIKALLTDPTDPGLTDDEQGKLREWILSQQHKEIHPFTNAAPGAWAWTDLSGAVPDADDTSGALLALRQLGEANDDVRTAAANGIRWLLDLQNQDGGFPTFCRGWGKLPFDRSCPEITAHAMHACHTWRDEMPGELQSEVTHMLQKGLRYLANSQSKEGYWLPLWFGNERNEGTNPCYGTATVVNVLRRLPPSEFSAVKDMVTQGCKWLIANQNDDGGWGARRGVVSTIEETSVAVTALCWPENKQGSSLTRGTTWLCRNPAKGPTPIGLYFASLWYYEKLYPIVFGLQALSRVAMLQSGQQMEKQ